MPGPVALTGATGFIGGHIAEQLLAAGHRVRALARRPQPERPGLDWIAGSLEESPVLERLVDGATAVVHCAGAVRGASLEHFQRANVEGTRTILEAAARPAVPPRFLLISSLAAREPRLSWYAGSKRAAELLLDAKRDRLSWAVFRPPAVYGPGDREILPLFLAMRRGWLPIAAPAAARFSLLHVRDLAGAVRAWLEAETPGATFELDDGRPQGYDWECVRQTAQAAWGRRIRTVRVPVPVLRCAAAANLLLARATGRAPMLTPGKVRELTHADWVCDNTHIVRALEWNPTIRLSDALAEPALTGL
jgi:nucleoside-diphosphate-sugar epimerase